MNKGYNEKCEGCGNKRSVGIINRKYYCNDCIWRVKRELKKNEKEHT